MRGDRDTFIIAAALMPIAAGIALFVMWRNSGGNLSLPSLPDISLPSISLPEIHLPLPGFVLAWGAYLQQHGEVMVPALLGGIIGGIVVMGIIVDLVRPLRRAWLRWRSGRRLTRVAEPEEQ